MRFRDVMLVIVAAIAPGLHAEDRAMAILVDCNMVEMRHDGVRIQILPELELFQILCQLSETYKGLNTLDFKYKTDIRAGFEKYKNHPAVSVLRRMTDCHPAHNCLKAYILNDEFQSDMDNLNLLRLEDTAARRKAITELRAACRQFAKDTPFVAFFEKHRPYYEARVQAVKTAVMGLDLITSREAFWGISMDQYRIVLALLESDLHSCWFTNNGQRHSLFMLTPKFAIDGDAAFGNAEISDLQQGKVAARDYIYYGSGHEFGHSVVNPLTQPYEAQINTLPLLYTNTGQPTKRDFLNESILRTFTAYEFVRQGRMEVAQMILQAEATNGYTYNEQLLALLQEYDQNRDRYPNFRDYLPRLLLKLNDKSGD